MGYSWDKPNLRNMQVHSATCCCIIELYDNKICCIVFADFFLNCFFRVFSVQLESKPERSFAHNCSLPINTSVAVSFSLANYVSDDVTEKNSACWVTYIYLPGACLTERRTAKL